jgi:hypothetical protein
MTTGGSVECIKMHRGAESGLGPGTVGVQGRDKRLRRRPDTSALAWGDEVILSSSAWDGKFHTHLDTTCGVKIVLEY